MRVSTKYPQKIRKYKKEDEYSYSDETKLIIACKMGDIAKVKELILKGVDPSLDNNKPLERACENGHDEIAKLLLKYPGVSFQGNSAIELAEQYKHKRCIDLAKDIVIQ